MNLVIRCGLVGIATLVLAWPAVFSTLAPYDDEGYVMMTLQTYLQGHRLYGDTHTQYGPAFYYLMAAFHDGLAWPLSQHGIRLKTMAIWGLAVALAYAMVHRSTRSPLAAVITSGLVAVHLDKLSLEAGHPQEIVLLCMLGTMWFLGRETVESQPPSPALASPPVEPSTDSAFARHGALGLASRLAGREAGTRWALLGMLAAIAGMTKLNAGILLAIPLVVAAVEGQRPPRSNRRWLVAVVMAFPLLIAWLSRRDGVAMLWAVFVAIAAAILFLRHSRTRLGEPNAGHSGSDACDTGFADQGKEIGLSPLIGVLMAGGGMTTLILGLALWQGIAPRELWHGLIGQHSQFSHSFFQPVTIDGLILAGLIGAAVWGAMAKEEFDRRRRCFLAISGMILLAVGATSFLPLEHGLKPRGAGLVLCWSLPLFLPWLWIHSDSPRSRSYLGLGLVALYAPLLAFPVAGTQVEMGTTPGLVLWGMLIGQLLSASPLDSLTHRRWMLGKPSEAAIRTMGFAVGVVLAVSLVGHWTRYWQGSPLALPGTQGIRLPEEVVREQRAVSQAIAATNCKHLFFEGHTNNRFYFWTGMKPLTAANPTFWPRMLSPWEETQIVDALQQGERICVVRVPGYQNLYGDRGQRVRSVLDSAWQLTSRIDDWQVGVVQWPQGRETPKGAGPIAGASSTNALRLPSGQAWHADHPRHLTSVP